MIWDRGTDGRILPLTEMRRMLIRSESRNIVKSGYVIAKFHCTVKYHFKEYALDAYIEN